MPFDAHVLNVLIASPGDTIGARDAVEKTLHGWNGDRSAREKVILLPRRWETDSVPLLGLDDGQSVINQQLVDEADILIGIFYSKLGQQTARAASGTAEEIDRAHRAGKPVHVYFSEAPLPRDVDPAQLTSLRGFKRQMEDKGLYGAFASEDDLRTKVRSAIEFDLSQMQLGEASAGGRAIQHAILRARYESSQQANRNGPLTTYMATHALVVENIGDVRAEDVTVDVRVAEGGSAPLLVTQARPDILARSEFAFPLIVPEETSRLWTVTMMWNESGVPMVETQDVSGYA